MWRSKGHWRNVVTRKERRRPHKKNVHRALRLMPSNDIQGGPPAAHASVARQQRSNADASEYAEHEQDERRHPDRNLAAVCPALLSRQRLPPSVAYANADYRGRSERARPAHSRCDGQSRTCQIAQFFDGAAIANQCRHRAPRIRIGKQLEDFTLTTR
jgi:hypothetical protein